MKCNHEGYDTDGNPCYYPNYEGEREEDVFAGYYCHEHAPEEKFCAGCGTFCAGIESFEFSEVYGYCDNCADEIKTNLDEFEEEEEEYCKYGHYG